MSLFDIDWNNDGKIDFNDTLYDMALVDEDERSTSRSDYSDDDIYDTDDLEILLSDNINITSSNTLVNNSGWLDNVPYELLSCWYLFYYNKQVYFNDYIKTLKSLHKCSYGVSVGVNVRIYTDNLDGDYKEAYTPFLNNLISNEIKKENEKAEKEITNKKASPKKQNINDIFTDAKKSIKEKEAKDNPKPKKADKSIPKAKKTSQKTNVQHQKAPKNANEFNIRNYIYPQKGFYYPAALRDKFKLKITVPNPDKNEAFKLKKSLEEIIKLRGAYFAVDVWIWCIREFYQFKNDIDEFESTYLFDDIMEIVSFDDRFSDAFVAGFAKGNSTHKMILYKIQSVWGIDNFFTSCFKTKNIELLKEAFDLVIKNNKLRNNDACLIISDRISDINAFDDFKFAYDIDTVFMPHALRAAQNNRILKKAETRLSKSLKEAEEKYQDEENYENDAEEENEEVEAENGIIDNNGDDIEGEEIVEEYHANSQNDTTMITAYQIRIDDENNSCYYFSKADLSPGDKVIVPYGKDNKQLNGTVKKVVNTQVKDFNVPISAMKYVVGKL